ncbi:unnamed protein product [Effrenium voratum]|nr:unnamed protein product [Effrenium voratum]
MPAEPAGSSAASAGGNTSAGSGNSSGLVDGQVSTLYWAEVDRALEAAALVTPSPESTTPTPDPYSAILGVSKGGQPENAENVGANNYELVTPPPPFPVVKKTPKVSVLPYGMALGAEVLYGMSEKVPTQPLPPQEEVDASFQAQCPNVTFASEVFITPPCNGGGLGSWSESPGLRNLLRWSLNSKGGIDFGIDHALWGKGSISFASLKEKMTLNTVVFELFNCMNVMRYSIEETIVKVNHMAPGAQSTAVDHDVGETATAVFYQYLIKHANGTLVAETSQYRLPETEINFTSFVPGTLRSQTFALAKRNKRWAGTDWRTCEHSQGWNISFPLGAAGNATAQDLQVAAAAVLTLLAWREEHVSSDGFEHEGQFYLYWSLARQLPPKG